MIVAVSVVFSLNAAAVVKLRPAAAAVRRGRAAAALRVYDGSTFSTHCHGSLCDHGNNRNYRRFYCI